MEGASGDEQGQCGSSHREEATEKPSVTLVKRVSTLPARLPLDLFLSIAAAGCRSLLRPPPCLLLLYALPDAGKPRRLLRLLLLLLLPALQQAEGGEGRGTRGHVRGAKHRLVAAPETSKAAALHRGRW